jgi:hypothetical protein
MTDVELRLREDRPATIEEHRALRDEIERLKSSLEIAHGALLCIGGSDSNWSEYARKVADEISKPLNQQTNAMCVRCGKVGPDTPWGPSFSICPVALSGTDEWPSDCFIAQMCRSHPTVRGSTHGSS